MSVIIHEGDVRNVLPRLQPESVLTCMTSPPYFGLRDYGSESQIGLEEEPSDYVRGLADVFDLLKPALHPRGTLWLNVGDTYAANRSYQVPDNKHVDVGNYRPMRVPQGMKAKDLMMIPSMLALALRDRGWYLRSDIIWHRPNVMPERVKDRPTTAHEHVFLLSKSPRYHFAAAASVEPTESGGRRNIRSVWSIHTTPSRGEGHHAAFPVKLAETCLKAGGTKYQCPVCREPYQAIEETETETDRLGFVRQMIQLNYHRQCNHSEEPTRPVVLDPFFGSGTVGVAATQLGMDCIGIEVNPTYTEIARKRLQSLGIEVQIRKHHD